MKECKKQTWVFRRKSRSHHSCWGVFLFLKTTANFVWKRTCNTYVVIRPRRIRLDFPSWCWWCSHIFALFPDICVARGGLKTDYHKKRLDGGIKQNNMWTAVPVRKRTVLLITSCSIPSRITCPYPKERPHDAWCDMVRYYLSLRGAGCTSNFVRLGYDAHVKMSIYHPQAGFWEQFLNGSPVFGDIATLIASNFSHSNSE